LESTQKKKLIISGLLLLVIPVFNGAGRLCAWYHDSKDKEKGMVADTPLMTSSNGEVVRLEKAESEVRIEIEDEKFFGGKILKSKPIDIPASMIRV
jgi:hypothetical protein